MVGREIAHKRAPEALQKEMLEEATAPRSWAVKKSDAASGSAPAALQVDGPAAVVLNAGPVPATPVGLLEIKWMGL